MMVAKRILAVYPKSKCLCDLLFPIELYIYTPIAAWAQPMKLMERVMATLRVKRYSIRTEMTYCYWIRFFIRFHKMRHPATMAGNEVRKFWNILR